MTSIQADIFLAEIVAVCRQHGISIAHEDTHGAFVLVPFNKEDSDWLKQAQIKSAGKIE